MVSNNISDHHYQEWLRSGVSSSLVRLNIRSFSGNSAYEHLLYGVDDSQRRNDGRLNDRLLRQYRHLDYGGWWCSGVDVLTGEENLWGCFKPDRPRAPHATHKPLKYEHPLGVPTEIFALKVSDDVWEKIAEYHGTQKTGVDFWAWVYQHPTIPIFITEGAKKAGALLSAGYVAIGLPGVNSGYRTDGVNYNLIPQLKHFAQRFREFVFAFDKDKKFKTQKLMANATVKMGNLFADLGCKSTVLDWEQRFGKGIDDVWVSHGLDLLDELIDERLALAEFAQKGKKKIYKLDSGEVVQFMDGEFEGRLSFDEIKGEVLLDGEPLQLSPELKVWFIKTFDYTCNAEDLQNTIAYMAKERSFNPVRQYLDSVKEKATRVPIESLAARYFGATNPLFPVLIKKWLIGAVARAYDPGCQMDYCLVLKGPQRIGKTSFFKILGGPWFDNSITDVSKEDALLVLYSCWIQELAELENTTSKRAAGEVKAFISRQIDRFRKKYDREISEHPRRSVLCATVNKTDFLVDETGNTRFLIVEISPEIGKLDHALFKAERDGVWASAVDAYFAGETWELTQEEEDASELNNKRFYMPDEWESHIEHYLQDKEYVTTDEILTQVFNFEPGKQERKLQMRVTSIFTKLGCQKLGQQMYQGRKQVVWKYGEKNKNRKVTEKGIEGVDGGYNAYPESNSVGYTFEGGIDDREKGVDINGSHSNISMNPTSIPPTPTPKVLPLESQSQKEISALSTPPIPFSRISKKEETAPYFEKREEPLSPGDWVEYEGLPYEVERANAQYVKLRDWLGANGIPIYKVKRIDKPHE